MGHHFILLRFNPFDLRVDREGWWFSTLAPQLRVCLSSEGAINVSWRSLSPLAEWGSHTIALTVKFVYIYIYIYMAHHFILLRFNPFDLRVDREG